MQIFFFFFFGGGGHLEIVEVVKPAVNAEQSSGIHTGLTKVLQLCTINHG